MAILNDVIQGGVELHTLKIDFAKADKNSVKFILPD